jgi:hypothetical protein
VISFLMYFIVRAELLNTIFILIIIHKTVQFYNNYSNFYSQIMLFLNGPFHLFSFSLYSFYPLFFCHFTFKFWLNSQQLTISCSFCSKTWVYNNNKILFPLDGISNTDQNNVYCLVVICESRLMTIWQTI